MFRKILSLFALFAVLALAGCSSDSNVSKANCVVLADYFVSEVSDHSDAVDEMLNNLSYSVSEFDVAWGANHETALALVDYGRVVVSTCPGMLDESFSETLDELEDSL